MASSLVDEIPQLIKVELVQERSIDPKVKVLTVLLLESSWMDPIIKFLAEDHLPNEGKEVDKVCKIANRFWLS